MKSHFSIHDKFSQKMVCLAGLGFLFLLISCGPSATKGPEADAAVDGDGNIIDPTDDGFVRPDTGPREAGMVGCNPQSFELEQAPPPEVFLVVDRSGSMLFDSNTPGMNRWEELLGATSLVLERFESQIQFGLLMYPSTDNECVAPGHQVQVGLYNRIEIETHLNFTTPNGGTPTAAALRNAAHSLEWLGDTGSEKFVILLTDGGPNCNYFLEAQPCTCLLTDQEWCCTAKEYDQECYFGYYCLDDIQTISVIESLHGDSAIDTFVIGLDGTEEFAELLNLMADAGGRPLPGETRYFDATNQTVLIEAMEEIAGQMISCVIELDEAPAAPHLVHIYIDGQEVPRNHIEGWEYTDGTFTAIELHGSYCEMLKDGENHDLTATFACEVD